MKSSLIQNCRRGTESRRFGLFLVAVALTAASLLATPASAQDAPVKIAVVDLEYVVASSPAGVALQQKLAVFSESVNADVKTRRDAANAIRAQMQQGANSLSAEKLSELQRQWDDADRAIKRFQEDKQREGQKMQSDGLREVESQLKPVFEALTAEEGYDLILNNVPGVIVMAGPKADITQLVVDRLKAAAAPAPAG